MMKKEKKERKEKGALLQADGDEGGIREGKEQSEICKSVSQYL